MLGKFGRNIKRIIAALVGLTVAIQMVIIFNEKTIATKRKLIRDHEEALCNFRLHRSETAAYENRQECPRNGIVTVFYAGGLYSQIWAYSSVWAVAKVTHLTPFVPICIHNYLSKVFTDLTIPPLTSISECDVPLPGARQSYESWSGSNESIVLPVFSNLGELVLPRLQDLIPELRIKEDLLKQGEGILRELVRNKFDAPTYVGVHLPRYWTSVGDGLVYPKNQFFQDAFQDIRKREKNAVFVIVAEEETNYFPGKDIFFVNGESFGLNLALLSLCNMSVLGFDSIGIWGAILSKGETIVFDDSEGKFVDYLNRIPNWKVFT